MPNVYFLSEFSTISDSVPISVSLRSTPVQDHVIHQMPGLNTHPIDPTFGLNRHVLNYSFIVCFINQEDCVTDLTIISFDLSADTRESEELEPADTCLCIVYTDKLLDVFTQEIFRVST